MKIVNVVLSLVAIAAAVGAVDLLHKSRDADNNAKIMSGISTAVSTGVTAAVTAGMKPVDEHMTEIGSSLVKQGNSLLTKDDAILNLLGEVTNELKRTKSELADMKSQSAELLRKANSNPTESAEEFMLKLVNRYNPPNATSAAANAASGAVFVSQQAVERTEKQLAADVQKLSLPQVENRPMPSEVGNNFTIAAVPQTIHAFDLAGRSMQYRKLKLERGDPAWKIVGHNGWRPVVLPPDKYVGLKVWLCNKSDSWPYTGLPANAPKEERVYDHVVVKLLDPNNPGPVEFLIGSEQVNSQLAGR